MQSKVGISSWTSVIWHSRIDQQLKYNISRWEKQTSSHRTYFSIPLHSNGIICGSEDQSHTHNRKTATWVSSQRITILVIFVSSSKKNSCETPDSFTIGNQAQRIKMNLNGPHWFDRMLIFQPLIKSKDIKTTMTGKKKSDGNYIVLTIQNMLKRTLWTH